MQEQNDKTTKILLILLVITIIVTIGLLIVFFRTWKASKPSTVKVDTYVGYVQEITPKENVIDGHIYEYVVGLLDKSGNSLPIWLTSEEFERLKFYDSRSGTKREIEASTIKGGQLLRLTRPANKEEGSIIIEIIN